MPRYFFALESSDEAVFDEDGEDFPDDASARRAARQTAREIGEWEHSANAMIVVKDKNGRAVISVPLNG
jgi:hypothetical protein